MQPGEVGYIEAHGTGTSLGDPIEVRALGGVFGPGRTAASPLYIGSVKTNFGHTEASAGIAGLIKAVLCLQNREIPPSLHFHTPNPHIAWEDLPVAVPTTVQAFPQSGARRTAGVSSFGFSGTNAHVIVEEAPVEAAANAEARKPRDVEILPLSAKSEAALAALASRYATYLKAHESASIADVCHTARVGRSHFAYRVSILAKDRTELLAGLAKAARGESSSTLIRGQVSGTSRVKVAAEDLEKATPLEIAQLYAKGVRIDWQAFDRDRGYRRVTLPTYPFQRQHYWVEEAPQRAAAAPALAAPVVTDASILGQRFDSPAVSGLLFTSRMGAHSSAAFAMDHRVFGVPILPGTGYIAMAFEAATQALASPSVRLANLVFHEALPLTESADRNVQVVARREGDEARIEIFSRAEGATDWVLHATADGVAGSSGYDTEPAPLDEASKRCTQSLAPDAFYADLRQRGLEFGPLFRGLDRISRATNEAVAEISLPESLHADARHYAIHPVLLDACLQVVAAALGNAAPDAVFMPLEIETCRIENPGHAITRCSAHARVLSGAGANAEVLAAEVSVYDESGTVLAVLAGIHFKRVNRATLARFQDSAVERWLIELNWEAERSGAARVSPPSIAASVRPAIAANSVATGWEKWNEVEPQLDRVCRDYIARALTTLGYQWKTGERLEVRALARQLRIKPDFVRLLGRFLDILADDGVLRKDGANWHVLRAPAAAKPDAALAALRAHYPAFEAEITFTERCGPELAAALTGATDPLQLLFPGGNSATAEHLYRDSPSAKLYNGIVKDAVAAAVASFPADRPLRVLEIGGGTASTTSHVVPVLPAARTQYLFTDVSPLFAAKATERFASCGFLTARALDIEHDPRGQGISGEFDIIIAANVLHATRDLAETFAHVRQLLAPGGMLLCVEITRPQDWIDLSFGLTEGWWRFTDAQLRPDYPLLTTAEWPAFLTRNGFEDVAIIPEAEGASRALTLNAVILARASRATAVASAKRLLVLADRGGVGRAASERLRKAGHAVCLAYEGDRYAREGDDTFSVDPLNRADFDRLLKDATTALAGTPDGVLHLWSIAHDSRREADVATLDARTARVMGGALHLAQALIAARMARCRRFGWQLAVA